MWLNFPSDEIYTAESPDAETVQTVIVVQLFSLSGQSNVCGEGKKLAAPEWESLVAIRGTLWSY